MKMKGTSDLHRLGSVPFKTTVKLAHLVRVISLARKTLFVLVEKPLLPPGRTMPVLTLVPVHRRSGQEVRYRMSKMQ